MNYDTLQKYIEGNASLQEKEDIARWLSADEKHMQDFLYLRYIHDATLWHKEELLHKEEKQLIKQNNNKKRKLVHELLKIAVVFLLTLGCYHLFVSSGFNSENSNIALQSVYSPEGQRTEVVLSDGTKVWLNAKSSLTFPNDFTKNNRIVELNGEAYFDVTHDEAKKFIVKTSLYDIKVHGTEFNVNAYNNDKHFETALIEGSVEVVSNSTNESTILLPNSKVSLEGNSLILSDIGSMDQFLWKKGILYFENLKVEDLFEKLELYYDVKIEVRNNKILEHRYTGKFWAKDGLEHLLKVLQLRHDFKFTKNNAYTKDSLNTIIIY